MRPQALDPPCRSRSPSTTSARRPTSSAGLWPDDAPLGRHPSVTVALPRLLDELDDLELRATFCVEALNCELYPDAVRGIAARGHEVAMHAWRHEPWGDLDPAREDALLARGRAAFAALGVAGVAGFRPPGGALTAASAARCSNVTASRGARRSARAASGRAASRTSRSRGRSSTPTTGSTPSRAAGRRDGDPEAALEPGRDGAALIARLAGDAAPTLILHPFLMVDDDGWGAARRVLRAVADRRAAAPPVATAGDVAAAL